MSLNVNAETVYPLTEAQSALWYAQSLDESNPIFNTAHYQYIKGKLDIVAFCEAINQTMKEAQGLSMRIVFTQEQHQPMQQFVNENLAQVQYIDLSQHTDAMSLVLQTMKADYQHPINLQTEAVAAQILFKLAEQTFIWYQRVHHIAADGYALALLERRVIEHYQAKTSNTTLGKEFAPYTQLIEDEQNYQQSERFQKDYQYWQQAIDSKQSVFSLSDNAGLTSRYYLKAECTFSSTVERSLQHLVQQTDSAWTDILLLLCCAYLCRHQAQTNDMEIKSHRITVGIPYMGRMGNVSARIPASVMNIVPLSLEIDEDLSIEQLLKQLRQHWQQALKHGRYRGEQIRRDFGLLGGSKRLYGPLINIIPFEAPLHLDNLQLERHILASGPVDDISFVFRGNSQGKGLSFAIEANPEFYSQTEIEQHLMRCHGFIERALQQLKLAEVQTLDTQEYQHWVYQVNNTEHEIKPTTLWALMQQAMKKFADRPALEAEGKVLSYAALSKQVDNLAKLLQQQGVAKGDFVAVCLPRSLVLPVVLYAILQVGAAYLPLDTHYPSERLKQILDSAKPKLVVSNSQLRHKFSEHSAFLSLDYLPEFSQAPLAQNFPEPFDAAYLIYTSGSTGMPKGVLIEHDAIVNRLLWMQAHYQIQETDRILQKTPYTFDVSVWEFFLPVIAGATLVMAPPDAHRDPAWLVDIVRKQHISTMHFVPSMLETFLSEPNVASFDLKRVFCSGEALPAVLRDRFHQKLNCELHNLYGPTEAAVDVSWWPASKEDTSSSIPIGFPVWNTQLYILDERKRPVAPKVVGHLYLGGRQLARGYLGREDLTQERFVDNPFAKGKMYCSGDLARWREDGAVEYLGRSDFQVKLRGQRIELEEIEHALTELPQILKAVVLLKKNKQGQQMLVAYIQAKPAYLMDVAQLRHDLLLTLPEYMVPSAFVQLEHFPVTSNGKMDRNALPEPEFYGTSGRKPKTEVQRAIAELFAKLLALNSVEQINLEDDFFYLGGHSLLAARLSQEIRRLWKIEFRLGAIFAYPTVEQLSLYIEKQCVEQKNQQEISYAGFDTILPLRKHKTSNTANAPLYLFHPAGGLGWCYRRLAHHLTLERDVYAVQSPWLACEMSAPNSLIDMANYYVDQMALHKNDKIHLGGWSIGGIIAQQVAIECVKRGYHVGTLMMMDAYPSDFWRQFDEPEQDAAYKALLLIGGMSPSDLPGVTLNRSSVIEYLRQCHHPLGDLTDQMLDGVIRVVTLNNQLVRFHPQQFYEGDVLFFQALRTEAGLGAMNPNMWQKYVSNIEIHALDCIHAHLPGAWATERIVPILEQHLASHS